MYCIISSPIAEGLGWFLHNCHRHCRRIPGVAEGVCQRFCYSSITSKGRETPYIVVVVVVRHVCLVLVSSEICRAKDLDGSEISSHCVVEYFEAKKKELEERGKVAGNGEY